MIIIIYCILNIYSYVRIVSLLGEINFVGTPDNTCSPSIGRNVCISSHMILCFSDLSKKSSGFSNEFNQFSTLNQIEKKSFYLNSQNDLYPKSEIQSDLYFYIVF